MGIAQKNVHRAASDFYSTYRYRVSKLYSILAFYKNKIHSTYNSSIRKEISAKNSMNSKYLLYIHTTL